MQFFNKYPVRIEVPFAYLRCGFQNFKQVQNVKDDSNLQHQEVGKQIQVMQ